MYLAANIPSDAIIISHIHGKYGGKWGQFKNNGWTSLLNLL